jgi:stage II sporulation protein D
MRIRVAAVLVALAFPAAASAGTVFLLDGRGWGHGVGMSQWGAEGYARHGYGYRKILAHYYSQTHIALAPPRQVRVLLARGQARVRVGSAAPFVVVDGRGHKLHLAARAVVVDRRLMLRHTRLVAPIRFEPGAQPLQVAGAGYRGDLVVRRVNAGLMVVNVLPLDRYLRGVVPWEVPKGWHPATYAAQAVAARSYTLATLHPAENFDLYPDQRSQMYGGIRAERPETNLAIGSTAGQVLVWRDRVIPAFYFSTSGGRTSSVHDAWPHAHQVPYLVSVTDPYDYISPHHVWPTSVLSASRIGAALHVGGVRDIRVVGNSSGRAKALRVLTEHGWRTFPAAVVRKKFALGSTDFEVRVMSLDTPAAPALFGARVQVHGWVRGLGKARLQILTSIGWQTLARIHPTLAGRFTVSVPARHSTELRLAYNAVAGSAITLDVVPRLNVRADGTKLRALVSPRLPFEVQRLTQSSWKPVAHGTGTFDRDLRPGSYRVAVLGGPSYTSFVSKPVGLHVHAVGP